MSRTVESSLAQLLALAQSVASPYTFLAEPNIPGGTIDPASWGVNLPLGLLTNVSYGQTFRESGEVGTPEGKPNQYLLRLLDSQYVPANGRIAAKAHELAFFDAFKDLIVNPGGAQCFAGVEWADIARERPEYIVYAGIQYVGSFIVVSLDERY